MQNSKQRARTVHFYHDEVRTDIQKVVFLDRPNDIYVNTCCKGKGIYMIFQGDLEDDIPEKEAK